jgi:hypothetical protein
MSIAASPTTSAEAKQFDFLEGEWNALCRIPLPDGTWGEGPGSMAASKVPAHDFGYLGDGDSRVQHPRDRRVPQIVEAAHKSRNLFFGFFPARYSLQNRPALSLR